MTEALENSEELPDNSLQSPKNEENSEITEKKGRGRPKGSLDKAPRKRIVIREEPATPVAEPVAPEPEPIPKPAPIPEPAPEPKKKVRRIVAPSEPVVMKTGPAAVAVPAPVAMYAPLSPRTLFRQAGETIYALQNQRETARRDYWAQQIGKSLR